MLKEKPYTANKYYYGESELLKEVKLYPIVQLIIVALFITIAIIALQTSYRSAQNQLWASMAKETAHQLGTPVSSLQGWLEILKEQESNSEIVPEIAKDVNRLLHIIKNKIHLAAGSFFHIVHHMMDLFGRIAPFKLWFTAYFPKSVCNEQ